MQLTIDLITNQLVGVCDNLFKSLDRDIKKKVTLNMVVVGKQKIPNFHCV